MREWFYNKCGQQVGPISQERLIELIKTSELSPETYIWTEGMPEWGLISKSPFAKLVISHQKPTSNLHPSEDKSENITSHFQGNTNSSLLDEMNSNEVKMNTVDSARSNDDELNHANVNVAKTRDVGGFMEDSEDRKRKVPKAYVHSGKYPSNAIFLVPVLSMLPLLILAPLYAAGALYIPVIYLNLVLIGAYGYACGFIVRAIGKIFKVRHSQLQYIFAAIVGVFAICFSWFFWVKFLTGIFIFSPISMSQAMVIIAEKGTWGIGSGTAVNGVVLYLFWLVEAAAIIVVSIKIAKINSPFCEKCDEWIETSDTFSPLDVCKSKPALVKNVMAGNFDALKSLGRQKKQLGHYTTVILTSCLRCNKMFVLSVNDIVETPKKDGKGVKTEKTSILENILIDYEDYKLLKKNWK